MLRALKILTYAVVFFLTYLMITGILKSCNQPKDDTKAVQVLEDSGEEGATDDFFEDGESTQESENDDFFSETEDEPAAASGIMSEETTENPAQAVEPITSSNNSDLLQDGRYMVVAGNYLVNTNAESMVLKLKRMGYGNAEIVIFDMSQYHTVVATKTDDYNSALSTSESLKSSGIDNYIHTRRN